jgi:hypothetical protein
MAFQDTLLCSQRLKSLKRKLMATRPSKLRTKVAFEAAHYVQLETARCEEKQRWLAAPKPSKPPAKKRKLSAKKPNSAAAVAAAEAASDVPSMPDRNTTGVSVAMTGVLRFSGIVDNKQV